MLSSLAKAFALLWQLFLILGPDASTLRAACDSIVAFITDSGAERLINNMHDIIPAFMKAIGCWQRARRTSRTFSFALRSQGWKHLCDVVMQRGFEKLPWWPSFLSA